MTGSDAPPLDGGRLPGRPVATTHAAIEEAAFRLFADKGFEQTTLQDIADDLGIGRRTLFRYFESKNDIPWGQFDLTLQRFRDILDSLPTDIPLHEAVHRAVIDFNRFPAEANPSHRDRMRLILQTPALQAHSVLRYDEWRQTISEYVARRTDACADDLTPQVAGHVSLALAVTGYESWLKDRSSDLIDTLELAMKELRRYLA